MKICKSNALRLWDAYYGNVRFAEDFHGNLMCRDGYGNANYCVIRWGRTVYCGWNIHHILPIACGGTNEKQNSLVRRFFPKGKSFDNITDEQVAFVENWINNLPRKIFNYHCSDFIFKNVLFDIAI